MGTKRAAPKAAAKPGNAAARPGKAVAKSGKAAAAKPGKGAMKPGKAAAANPGKASPKPGKAAAGSRPAKRARNSGGGGGDEGEVMVDGLLAQLRALVDADGGGDEAVNIHAEMDDEMQDEFAEVMAALQEAAELEGELGSEAELGSDDSPGASGEEDEVSGQNGESEDEEDSGDDDEDVKDADAEGSDDEGSVSQGSDGSMDSGSEGSEDMGTLGGHKQDLEALKKTDPAFYKYLKENDAGLLDVGDDDDDEGNCDADVEMADDEPGGCGSEGSDAAEEAAALAEAGLGGESDVGDDEEGEVRNKARDSGLGRGVKVVDMDVVRDIEAQLKLNRGAVKAVKELMRMLRAGRDLTAVAQSGAPTKADKMATGRAKARVKAKMQRKSGKVGKGVGGLESDSDSDSEGEEEGEEVGGGVDADGFLAGDVKFASARVYQKVMYLAIVRVQETLDRMLGKPKARAGSVQAARWSPKEHTRWRNLEPIVRSFVSQLLSLADGMQDPSTLRFLLKRAELLVPYTRGDTRLSRRLIKLGLGVWSPETRDVGEATKLRAYLLLRAIADEPSNVEAVLRAVHKEYVDTITKTCNPRTLPNILFSAKCIVDLFGIDMAASYTVAFSYLREMAVTLRSVLTSKDQKADSDKVHNWSFVNALRLWSMVLSTYGAEAELRPLIYPFVQVSVGVMRVQPTPRTYPVRLHIASYLTNIVSETGVYVPIAAQLLPLLRCGELRRKPARGATKDLEWRALLRVGDETVKTKPFLTGLVNGSVFQLAAFFAAISRHVSFPEVSHDAAAQLRKFSKEAKSPEWRASAAGLADKLRASAAQVAEARARADFGPHGAASARGMLEPVPGLDAEGAKRTPVQRFYDVEAARVKREEGIRDEALQQRAVATGAARYDGMAGHGDGDGEADEEEGEGASGSDSAEDGMEGSEEARPTEKKKEDKKRMKKGGKAEQRKARPATAVFRVNDNGKLAGGSSDEGDEVGALQVSSDED